MVKFKQAHFDERVKPDIILQHPPGWWQRMEHESESARRMDRQRKDSLKKDQFRNRVQPNQIL